MEKRLERLEVYADEEKKEFQERLLKMEKILEPFKEEGSVENRIRNMENEWKKIPPRLITHWNEVENQMKTWHKEETERKEAVQAIWKKLGTLQEEINLERTEAFQAIWKKLGTIQEDINMKALEEDMEEMKGKVLDDMKELFQQIQNVENQGTERGGYIRK